MSKQSTPNKYSQCFLFELSNFLIFPSKIYSVSYAMHQCISTFFWTVKKSEQHLLLYFYIKRTLFCSKYRLTYIQFTIINFDLNAIICWQYYRIPKIIMFWLIWVVRCIVVAVKYCAAIENICSIEEFFCTTGVLLVLFSRGFFY